MATRAPRILRLGVVVDGKIVQERLVHRGDPVTLGPSPSNTFVYEKTGLPGGSWAVFVPTGEGYQLHFTDQMRGKVSSRGSVVSLDQLRQDSTLRKGGRFCLPLTDGDRGKVCAGDVTLLFQFVEPPPTNGVMPLTAMDFRPRLLEEDDPIFLGFLAINSAMAAVLTLWVWQSPVPEITPLDKIPDRFWTMALPPEQPPEALEPEDDLLELHNDEPAVAEVDVPDVPEPPEVSPDPVDDPGPPLTPEERRAQKEAAMLAVARDKYAVLIGSKFGDGVETDFDVMSPDDGMSEPRWDDGAIIRGPRGNQGPDDEVPEGLYDDGPLGPDGPGPTIKDVPKTPYVPTSLPPELPPGTGSTEADQLKEIIQGYFPRIARCYESQLKDEPTLAGRIDVEWTIMGGKTTEVAVMDNTTDSRAFERCVTMAVGRWNFEGFDDITVAQGWSFRPKK